MADKEENCADLETWLDGIGSLKEVLLQKGLQHQHELLWLSPEEIELRN